jgi:uncharacterized protein YuzB (UPF0349 family)
MEQSLRYNEGKPQWSLVDFKSLEPMVRVMEYGCQKYDRDNWKKGLDLNQILESLSRHLFALMSGEIIDPESGQEHVGHIMANAMFWQYHNEKQKVENSDINPMYTEKVSGITYTSYHSDLINKLRHKTAIGLRDAESCLKDANWDLEIAEQIAKGKLKENKFKLI